MAIQHIGGICDPSPSHIRGLASIARELQALGYRFTIFHDPVVAAAARVNDIAFRPIGPDDRAETERRFKDRTQIRGVSLSQTTGTMIRTAEYLLRYGPQEIRSQCIDALIVDQGEPGGATLADLTGIPFISLCATLPLNSDDLLPLPIPAGQPLMRLEAPTGKAAV